MVSTRAQQTKGRTTRAQGSSKVNITTQVTQVSTTVSASASTDVAMPDVSIATASTASSDQTSNSARRLIVTFKLGPRLRQFGVTGTNVVVASKVDIKEKPKRNKSVRQQAAAIARGIKRESTDQDLDTSPPKKSKQAHGEDEDEFEPDHAMTQALGIPTAGRALRGRGGDGTVTGRIKATRKAKEDLRGPFITLQSKGLGMFLKKLRKRRPATPYTNTQRFQFGHDHLWYWTSPSPYNIRKVYEILDEEKPAINEAAALEGTATNPFHASVGISVDSIVRVILSQACTNEAALDAQQAMLLAYPYRVGHTWVTGQKPNYHAMRVQSLTKLEKVLKKAGLANKKPKAIKDILDIVYQRNVALLDPLEVGEVLYDGNERGASDFVPGLLSVDYFWDIYRQEGKQALLDHLVSLPLIGVKSASCLMCFNMSLPVFAVDTHVAGMAKLLDKIKLSLHQAFWNHRRKCARCSARNNPSSWVYNNTTCPLELLVKRPQPKSDENKPAKLQTSPPRQVTKKEPSDEERVAQGLVKVTYEIDDDFDAAGGTGVKRTIWIRDFSAEEYDPVDEKEFIYEEISIDFRQKAA
ncbi:hypothetical protein AYO20_07957 [Fonsecaea nubica]|uniref:HhH-GPD domain-containing protein n=1 Tax=Fonsecaea nubica TaxID=856822 RepID=A0A178CQS9_9EURO|nr:hypothetical protein AYO20_07957 [Fonsecaea nubica]OAL32189.1 hypothetical protein AYO20_07957 [Fonsecaea nubica]